MKKIIDGKLYSTEKAEKVIGFIRKQNVTSFLFPKGIDSWVKSDLYKTSKGAWFEVIGIELSNPELNVIDSEEAKALIQKCAPDKFLELYPEEVEEA